jgi:hypothetical protein
MREHISKKDRIQPSLGRFHTTGTKTINQQQQFVPILASPTAQDHAPQLAKIIVGFPGIGKSFVSQDKSPQFSWLHIYDEPGYEKGAEASFHSEVLRLAQHEAVLLLPAHRTVGAFLMKHNLVFTSVFPKSGLREEYLRRYQKRGSSQGFVELVEKQWDDFVKNMWYLEGRCNHVELSEGQFLKDVFGRILLQADATGTVKR